MSKIPVFDLDGTLLDSDDALLAPFLALGVPRERVGFGMTLDAACHELGVTVEEYLRNYDGTAVRPFSGIDRLLARLDRWAIFSNKRADAGKEDLRAAGWQPHVAMFFESFRGPKTLTPVLEALRIQPSEAICIGDSEHDRACAHAAGVGFVLAGWNPRAVPAPGDTVLKDPEELLDLL